MSYVYAVLGGGRQGTAAAYDMAKYGEASKILIADISLEAAQKSAARVNALTGREAAEPHQGNVSDAVWLKAFLSGVDSFLSAVPYWYNPAITRLAIESGRAGPDHRAGAGEGAQRRPTGPSAGGIDRLLRRGDRVHRNGAHHRLGRLDQDHPECPGGHPARRPPGRGRRPRAAVRFRAAQKRLQPDGDIHDREKLK